MKKSLLSLAAVALTATMASAETVTFDFVNEDYGLERGNNSVYIDNGTVIESDGISVTLNKEDGNGWRLWTDGLRMYKKQDHMVISGGTIESVTWNLKATAGTDYAVSTGSFELTNGNKTFTWTGSATELTIDVNPTANVAIQTMVIEYSTGGSTLKPAELSFTMADVNIEFGEAVPANALINPNNLPVTWTSSDEAVATVAADGTVTVVAPGTTTITAASEATEEFRAGKASYILSVAAPAEAAKSIAQMLQMAEDGVAEIRVDFPMTVTYKNGGSTYVTDGKDFTLLYGNTITDYEAQDIIPAGWTAKYSPFNNLPEFVATTTMAAATEKGNFTPREVALADVNETMLNEVMIITGVTFDEMTPDTKANFTGYAGEAELLFRNNFLLASVAPDTYNVLAVPAIYKTDLQVYPLDYNPTVGVAGIEAEDGVAVYYNMQGVRVENPSNGLYIIVRGNKATKQVIR